MVTLENARTDGPLDGASLAVRTYGDSGPHVVVIHGGPGAAGYMAPVARQLSARFRVAEPLQRMTEKTPLTVQRHVDDLHAVIATHCSGESATLVGHSWGAMLALAYAAAYPDTVTSVVVIGCGTFDSASREILEAAMEQRMTQSVRARLERLSRTVRDPDVRMCAVGRVLENVYSYDLVPHQDETEYYDARGHNESWRDMLRLQRDGYYPAAFSHISVPVLMLHGAHDPHPGRSTYACLQQVMPQIEYVELARCGHYPWWERHAATVFFDALREWLSCHAT